MKWNFRIIHKKMDDETAYRIHEVYYGEKGKIANWAKLPVKPSGSNIHELRNNIRFFWSAFRLPVLTEAKDEEGQEMLRELEGVSTPNPGTAFEVMDRASVAISHFDDFVAAHPVVCDDAGLAKKAAVISGLMYQLYNELAVKIAPEQQK